MAENTFSKCDYCNLLLQHIHILENELKNTKFEYKNNNPTLLELKCYYWLLKEYSTNLLSTCECTYKNIFEVTLIELSELFQIYNIKLDINKRQCDICNILPCELFSLMDLTCKITDTEKMESMYKELEYHFFLSWIYDNLIGRCTSCDEFVEYAACLENTCDFLIDKDLNKLKEFVYFWKIAKNNDELLGCADSLTTTIPIKSEVIKLDNHITVYLDFNVYDRYEKDSNITEFFQKLIQKEDIDVIYSGTHLEEILRMGNEEYQSKRINSIQTLTHGKIVLVGRDKKTIICIEDIFERLKQVKQYQEINAFAEERECIKAESREHLSLHINDELRDKLIATSSIQQMIDNAKDSSGNKTNPILPDADELNKILRYVGIGSQNIQDYKDIFKDKEAEFHQINSAIVSIANMLNILGLHNDKITNKNSENAIYPIYHKKSYRTIRSGYYDNDHLSFASKCTYFITSDVKLCKRAQEIYEFLGINTIPITLDEFSKIPLETLSKTK